MGALPRPPEELLQATRYPAVLEIATRYGDLDPNSHVNNVAMASLFEEARSGFVRSLGLAWPLDGRSPMVAAIHIDYLAEAFYPQPVRFGIGVAHIGRSSWTLAALAQQRDTQCALCRATLVCTRDGRPAPLPQTLRDGFERWLLRPA